MNNKITALGISVLSAVALTFSTVGPVGAAPAADSLSEAVCTGLGEMVTDVAAQIVARDTEVTETGDAATTAKGALELALNELAPAVVAHVQAVSDGVSSVSTGQAMAEKFATFSDKWYAAHTAMTLHFEAQRAQYLTGLNGDYIGDTQTGLCV